ncbi:hypothetical protein Tco_1172259 [Tanacetum coccineum]
MTSRPRTQTPAIAPVISFAGSLWSEDVSVASPLDCCGLDSPIRIRPLCDDCCSLEEQAISFGRPYRTHLNEPRKLLTARKRVGPLTARRLAWRCISPRSLDHRLSSSSSSSDSPPVHSSGLDAPDQAHSGSLTRDLPPRLGYPPRRAPRRNSYSSKASIEEDTEIDPIETEGYTEEYEADTSAGDTVEVGIDPMSTPIVEEEIIEPAREDPSDSSGTRDGIVSSFEDMLIDLDDVMSRGQRVSMIERIDSLRSKNLKVRAMSVIERDRVNSLRLHMSLSQEEFRQVRRDHDDTRGRLRRLESTMTITRSGMTLEAIGELVNRRVEEALAAHEATRAANALETENQSQNGSDGDNGNGGNGNGGNGNGRNENPDENGIGDRPVARECTYQDFMKCQLLNFKGTEGVVGLIRLFEKMETVFHISNCPEKSQVKYATCTLLDCTLT